MSKTKKLYNYPPMGGGGRGGGGGGHSNFQVFTITAPVGLILLLTVELFFGELF